MTKRMPIGTRAQDHELEEALAVLISSTHSKRRPLALTEIAKWLSVAIKKLGTYEAVADRIGVSSKMIRQFSYVGRLSKSVQRLFAKRLLDSVDAATHLAMLPTKAQKEAAKAMVDGKIDSIDLRAVIQLRRYGQRASSRDLLKRVQESKTRKEYVAEFVIRGDHSPTSMLALFHNHIPSGDILRVEADGALGRLVLTLDGKRSLAKTAKHLGVPIKHVIPTILQT